MAPELAGDRSRAVPPPAAPRRAKLLVVGLSMMAPIMALAAVAIFWRSRPDPLAEGWKSLHNGQLYQAYRIAVGRFKIPVGMILEETFMSFTKIKTGNHSNMIGVTFSHNFAEGIPIRDTSLGKFQFRWIKSGDSSGTHH